MKKLVLFSILLGTAGLAAAQERGRVLSATPIVQQVAYPRQVCSNETVYSGQRNTGGRRWVPLLMALRAMPSAKAMAARQPPPLA